MQAQRTRDGDVPRNGRSNHTSDIVCWVRMEVRMYSVSQQVRLLPIVMKKVTASMIEAETTVETKIDSKSDTHKQIH